MGFAGFFKDDDAFFQLKMLVQDEAKGIADSFAVNIDIDIVTLYEAYWSARQTASRHKNLNPSYNKEAAHLCFWINKLKPARMTDKLTIISGIKGYLHSFFPENSKELSKILEIEDKLRSPKPSTDSFNYPINEKIALMVAFEIVLIGDKVQKRKLEEDGKIDEVSKLESKIERNIEIIQQMSKPIIHSLRRDTYSAKSMAISFEWIFAN